MGSLSSVLQQRLTLYSDYKRIFDSIRHSRLTEALSATYADIIILCLEIKDTLHIQQRSTLQRLWKPLSIQANKQLDQAVERFRKHRMKVEAEARTAHMIEEADARAIVVRNIALVEAKKQGASLLMFGFGFIHKLTSFQLSVGSVCSSVYQD